MREDFPSIVAALIAKPVTIAVAALVLVASFSYCAGQRNAKQDATVAALVDTIRLTDSLVRVQTETLTVYRTRTIAAKASSDSAKQVSDSVDSLVVADTSLVIHPLVVADLAALRGTVAKQDTTIHWLTVENRSLWMRDTTRMKQIEYRDQLLNKRPPRLEKWAGVSYDLREKYTSVTAGASFDLWKGIGADLYVDQPLIRGERPYVATRIGFWRTF